MDPYIVIKKINAKVKLNVWKKFGKKKKIRKKMLLSIEMFFVYNDVVINKNTSYCEEG